MQPAKKYPKGHFDKFLVIDCETSGLNLDTRTNDVTDGYQSVSWGLIVSDLKTLKPIDELYIEIKWDGVSKWNLKAEEIHGLSKEYLDKHGVDEQEAAETIALFLAKHFEPEDTIVCMGINVARFDIPFLSKLLNKFDFPFHFSHRAIDIFSYAVLTLGTFTSDELFETLGIKRAKQHNALEDARCTLKACRLINKIVKDALGDK